MKAVIYIAGGVVGIWVGAAILLLLDYAVPNLGIGLEVQRVVSVSVALSGLLFLGSFVVLLLRIAHTSAIAFLIAALLIIVFALLLFPGFLLLLELLVPGLGISLGAPIIAAIAAGISALLALFGVLISQVVSAYTTWLQRKSEREAAQQDALQNYLKDALSPEQLNDTQPPDAQQLDEPTREVTSKHDDGPRLSARTQSLLLRLDGNRKRVLLQFLHGANLIARDKPDSIDLSGASLAGAHLESIDLSGDSLKGANLRGANLRGACLDNTDFSGADLKGADLRDAHLSGADLRRADLRRGVAPSDVSITKLIKIYSRALEDGGQLGSTDLRNADLSSANLTDAYLAGANFTEVKGVTEEELEQQANSLKDAMMPKGQKYK
jgi:uncharacterized protein YjbI with pentapeptide repeats